MKKLFCFISMIAIGFIVYHSVVLNESNENNNTNNENDDNQTEELLEYNADKTYLGINLAGVKDYSTEYPFKDIFKMTREWRTESTHQDYVNFIHDENGWITNLNGNSHAVAYLVNQYLPVGEYVMTYEGSGEIAFFGPYVETTSKQEGKIEFTITQYGIKSEIHNGVKITSLDSNYIKNIQIVEKQYLDTLDDIFNPKFIENISIFNDLRFMDWMQTNNSKVSNWDDRPKVDDCTWSIKGIPLEVMVDLCNKVRANPWFCMPHSATDEYMINFAKYVENNLDKKLVVYIENSNEAWNGLFGASAYNLTQGKLHENIPNTDADWKISTHYYAQRAVEMFNIWDENYTSNLIKVLPTQSSNYGVGTTILNYELADGSKAGEYADALAIAPYIGNSNEAGVDFTKQDELFNHLDDELTGDFINDLEGNKSRAELYGLDLICYEGGQHLVDSTSDAKTTSFIEANKSIKMGEVYTKYLDTWCELIGNKMFLFSSTGRYNESGSWGLLEYQ